jgi:hypothetical protein
LGGTKTVVTDGTGKATFSDLSISGPNGSYRITFSAAGLGPAGSVTSTTIAIGAGVAAKLAFTRQPSNVAAGAAISPAVEVTIEDGSGNVVSSATDAVTIAIGNNPGGGTLSGTVTVAAVAGVATFSDLSINKSGNGYTLAATSGSLTGATSAGFNVHAGPASQIAANSAQNQGATVGTTVPADPSVIVRDANGNAVSGVQVTFAVTNGGGSINPGNGSVNTHADGTATLNSWTLGPNPGANQVTATASGLSGSPVTFNATGSAALSISTSSPLPSGTVGVAYSTTLTPAGGSAPYSWSVVVGSLPAGLNIDANTGVISGTPTAAGPNSFTIQLEDATTTTTTKGFQLSVAKANTTTTITNVAPEPSNVGGAITVTVSVTAAIGTPTGSVTVDDGQLIPGTCTIPDISTSNSCSFTPNVAFPTTITLTAQYAGDANYNSSSGSTSHTVQ